MSCESEVLADASNGEPPAKVPKRDLDLSQFKMVRQINCMSERKAIFLHVTKNEQPGIIILEKQPFDEVSAGEVFGSVTSSFNEFSNDIYSDHKIVTKSDVVNEIKTTLVYPATDRHFLKYSQKEPFLVEETQAMYESIVRPFFQKQALSSQWVYNILEKKSEVDRIICEDPEPQLGFVMIPDLRADVNSVMTFHALAIVQRRDVMSVRDLRGEHLPLLRNVRDKCLEAIQSKFAIAKSKLRVLLHYQPSFYHLHVHFVSVYVHGPHVEIQKALLLSDVIQNIEGQADYYQKRTLSYVLNEKDPLMQLLNENKAN